MCSDADQNKEEDEDDRMRRRNDEWFENENSSCSRCQVPTRTLIDPAGPLLLSLDDDDDDDICIMMQCVFVTKNHHFLLGVSCNHLNHPKPPCTIPGWF